MLRSNLIWSVLEAGLNAALAVVSTLVIARLIGAQELGIGVAATAGFQILQTGLVALFHDGVIQRPTLTPRETTTAAVTGAVAGLIGAVIMIGTGHLLAQAWAEPRIETFAWPLAATLPISAAAAPAMGLMIRRRALRMVALRSVLAQIAGFSLGVGAAVAGFGATAVVVQAIAVAMVVALLSLLAARDGFGRGFDAQGQRGLLATGLPNGANALLSVARYRLFVLLLGITGGAAFLGHLHIAFRMIDAVRDLVISTLHRIVLPAFSERQADRAAIRTAHDQALRMIMLFAAPLFLGLGLGFGPLVRLLLGPGWEDSVAPGWVLAGLAVWALMRYPAGVVKLATGRSIASLGVSVALTALTVLLVLVFAPTDPWTAALVWAVPLVLLLPVTVWQSRDALGVGLVGQTLPAMRPLLVALGALGCGLLPILLAVEPDGQIARLVLREAAFLLGWLALAAMFLRRDLTLGWRVLGARK